MNESALIDCCYTLSTDRRLAVWHLGLYMAILYHYRAAGWNNPFHVSRKKLMALSHIRSIATYHRCISALEEYGYIRYCPSYHPLKGSSVSVITNVSAVVSNDEQDN